MTWAYNVAASAPTSHGRRHHDPRQRQLSLTCLMADDCGYGLTTPPRRVARRPKCGGSHSCGMDGIEQRVDFGTTGS